MSLMARELRQVWDALRASNGHRDEALTAVRISRLRGIRDIRIPFEYPVSVLAGPNGSGKSTVLFACACAYRVPGGSPRDLTPGRLFPDFTSRQQDVSSDAPQPTQIDFQYLHHGDDVSMSWKRGRSWRRSFTSRNGERQPERPVYLRTLANLTNPSEVRSLLRLGRRQVQTAALDPDLLTFAHRILPWRYSDLSVISGPESDLLFAEIEGREQTRYSEFHMSSGERSNPAHLEGRLAARRLSGPHRRDRHRPAPLHAAAGDARTAAQRAAPQPADHRGVPQPRHPRQRAGGGPDIP